MNNLHKVEIDESIFRASEYNENAIIYTNDMDSVFKMIKQEFSDRPVEFVHHTISQVGLWGTRNGSYLGVVDKVRGGCLVLMDASEFPSSALLSIMNGDIENVVIIAVSEFNPYGKWWSESSLSKYHNRMFSFIDLFDNIVFPNETLPKSSWLNELNDALNESVEYSKVNWIPIR